MGYTAGAAMRLVLMIVPGCKWLSLSRLPLHVAVPVALGGGLLLGLTAITLIEPILSLLGRSVDEVDGAGEVIGDACVSKLLASLRDGVVELLHPMTGCA